MKIISFSLWGSNSRYTLGALQNASLAKMVYPDWICRYYVGKSTPQQTISQLSEFDNVEIVEMEEEENWTSTFWRFLAAGDDSVEVMISRDVDSRLWFREKKAVDEWLDSDKDFHIMRDHPYHGVPILAGMWGARGNILKNIKKLCNDFEKKKTLKQVDQNFLAQVVFPMVEEKSFIHDEYFTKDSPFPTKRNEKHFVGQAYAGCGRILSGCDEYFQEYMREEYDSIC